MRLAPAWVLTAVAGLAYVILAPPSSDLAAAAYRSDLFARVGFTLWDNSWYGGHHLLAYSLLAPALGALLGPQLLAALSMTLATGMFAVLIEGRFPAATTRLAAAWFAFGASVSLLSNRIPFDLGLAIALAALVLAQRGRFFCALLVAVISSLASPVAGAFLALAFVAWGLAGPSRAWPCALAAAALAPIALLEVAFPEGGTQPFAASAFYPAAAGAVAIALLLPRERLALRIGVALYAIALVGSYVLPTAVGSNSDRFGALLGAPLAALALLGGSPGARRPRMLLVAAPLLLYWQLNASVSDLSVAISDPAVHASYYAPLLRELKGLGVGYSARPARVEVVPVNDHWEARWMAPHVMLARGWERQLDRARDGLFYRSAPLTAARYGAWLSAQAVSYVALPDAALDYAARAEGRLLRGRAPGSHGGPPAYLSEIWHSAHWLLFAVRDPRPLLEGSATLGSVDSDSFTVTARRPGRSLVRIRFTPYWALASGSGCVSRAPEGWTQISARHAGSLHVVIRFSLDRLLGRGPRCD